MQEPLEGKADTLRRLLFILAVILVYQKAMNNEIQKKKLDIMTMTEIGLSLKELNNPKQ